jgi:ADP-ribosyl-[dinitrogen reductase] hydrolase
VCVATSSDSTAAIAGNLLGAHCGEGGIPQGWLNQLELRNEIADLADDLYCRPND